MSPARMSFLLVDDDVDARANLADFQAEPDECRVGVAALEPARDRPYD